jgi:hypothetical protein
MVGLPVAAEAAEAAVLVQPEMTGLEHFQAVVLVEMVEMEYSYQIGLLQLQQATLAFMLEVAVAVA